MRKKFLIGALSLMSFGIVASTLTSCQKKKDWTCKCTVAGQSVSLPIQDQKKKDAEKACDAAETTYATAGNASCSLD